MFLRLAVLVGVIGVSVVVQGFPPTLAYAKLGELRRDLAEARSAKAGSPAVTAQDPPNKQSIWDGVYTEQQAKRGETTYGRACEACHGADLSGDPVQEVPSLVWDAFLAQWSDRTVKDLYETIKRSMPRDAPGSLNARAYADVIAYMLQSNKIPAGTKELSLNPEAQALIVIERQRQ